MASSRTEATGPVLLVCIAFSGLSSSLEPHCCPSRPPARWPSALVSPLRAPHCTVHSRCLAALQRGHRGLPHPRGCRAGAKGGGLDAPPAGCASCTSPVNLVTGARCPCPERAGKMSAEYLGRRHPTSRVCPRFSSADTKRGNSQLAGSKHRPTSRTTQRQELHHAIHSVIPRNNLTA